MLSRRLYQVAIEQNESLAKLYGSKYLKVNPKITEPSR